ncbi:MAG: thiamine pyrophosphate-dependent dehydrogenase E1 component subunit alpha [Acidimicrobiales bacterium]
MTRIMRADERIRKGISRGELMSSYWPCAGQEAVAAGVGAALRADDWMVTTYRGLHDQLAKGVDMASIFAEMAGRATGACGGKGGTMHVADPDRGLMLSTGIVGAGIPVGAGLGLASKLRGEDRVTVVSFGDGAVNTGAFHEGVNLAAIWALPVVFVCQNNGFGEMTPISRVQRVERVSERAAGYGIPGVTVDGNDPVAVWQEADAAVGRARQGGGPTLLECVTYRLWGHYFGDPMEYMAPEELSAARNAHPVDVFRARLIDAGVLDAAGADALADAATDEVAAAWELAMAAPPAAVEAAFEDVYGDA